MAFPSEITAAETDVNSPLSQTLMDKIRGWIAALYERFHATTGHNHGGTTDQGPLITGGGLATSVAGGGLLGGGGAALSVGVSAPISLVGDAVGIANGAINAVKLWQTGVEITTASVTLVDVAATAIGDYAFYPKLRCSSNGTMEAKLTTDAGFVVVAGVYERTIALKNTGSGTAGAFFTYLLIA